MPFYHTHGTVEDILRSRPDPYERPVCTKKNDCANCFYAATGFLCWHQDGTCLHDDMLHLMRKCTLPC